MKAQKIYEAVGGVGSCKPIRMWIDGHCFNLSKNHQSSSEKKYAGDKNACKFEEYTSIPFVTDGDDNKKLSFSFRLPYQYYLALKQGEILDIGHLSRMTSTTISIPKLSTDQKMTLNSETKENMLEALKQIHYAVGYFRQRSSPLQFLSVRCLSEEVQRNFEKFKSDVLAEKDMKGVEESIFQKPAKLHLTMDVLVLFDENEKKEAIAALKQFNESIMRPLLQKTGPLRIFLSGIECMNNKYENVNVLYAKAKLVDESEDISLQKIANDLAHYFYERGLLKSYEENVKLHCTLMNTKYRKETSTSPRKFKKKISFDARRIMEKYKDFEFGQCDFNKIHLSIMSSVSPDGYYQSLSTIDIG